jgi:hypothetical protein
MPATADDIVSAMDRLAKALEAQDARKEKDKVEREEGKKARDQERADKEKRRRDENAQQAADDEAPTFHPATTLGKMEGAWKKYKQIREGIDSTKAEGAGDPFKFFGKLFGKGGAEGEAAGTEAGAGKAGGSVAGGAAGAAGSVLAVVTVIWEYGQALLRLKAFTERYTDQLVQSQQRLADVSGSMAAVYAQREIQELLRDQRRGEALAESASYMTGAEQRRKDATMPIETAITSLENRMAGFLNDIVAGMAKVVNGVLGLTDESEKDKAANRLTDAVQHIRDDNQKRMENERARLDRIKEQAGKGRRFG